MDEQDIEMIINLFVNHLGRNPTDVEIYQWGQSNSEHSRHPFFTGRLVIDGQQTEESLMDIIKYPWKRNSENSLVAFNGSVIRGYEVEGFLPLNSGMSSLFHKRKLIRHLEITAETHCYPTGVDPYNGAATGPGGRIRDVQVGAGRGAHFGAGGAGYFIGNLHIIAISFWIGGLFFIRLCYSYFLKASESSLWGTFLSLINKFSKFATISVLIVGVTGLGLFFYSFERGNIPLSGWYGLLLIFKTFLAILLIILGSINKFFFLPKINRTGSGEWTKLAQIRNSLNNLMTAEVIIALGILLSTSVLTHLSPRG